MPKKKADAPIYEIKSERDKILSRFGWCSTNQHELCAVTASTSRCSCECHPPLEDATDQ